MHTLYWLTRDLRLHDNPALTQAARSEQLLCVFVVEPRWFVQGRFEARPMGWKRWRFLWESLMSMDASLRALGQRLHIAYGDPVETLPRICSNHCLGRVVASHLPGTEEAAVWNQLQSAMPGTVFESFESLSLFNQAELPMDLSDLPGTFSAFRRRIEKAGLYARSVVSTPSELPPAPGVPEDDRARCPAITTENRPVAHGGELAAVSQLNHYFFGTDRIAHYRETRNALDNATASSRLGFWLANGSLSAASVAAEIKRYEQCRTGNDSTYWLWFELLWREFFHWYALRHRGRLFHFRGVSDVNPSSTFYSHQYQAWCVGSTEWPLVNAAMNQLRETGYLSNRARQIAASALVNELGVDWRFGAAWFQQELIDYDVGSNWGNWQYIAGVGADARGGRHFNLAKQAAQFDPRGEFVERWEGRRPAGRRAARGHDDQ